MSPTQRPGMSVIEVLVALGMASILIFSVGNLVSATHRLNSASASEEKAVLVAQAQLEQLASFANDPATAGSVFSAANDGSKKYYINTTQLLWVLEDVTAASPTNWITITATAGDANVQNVTSFAKWTNGTVTHQEQISTIITDWKNLVP